MFPIDGASAVHAGLNAVGRKYSSPVSPLTREERMANMRPSLEEAAAEHARCVARGQEYPPDSREREQWVTKILAAGARLDSMIEHALKMGWTPEELATLAGLHESYVESLTQDPL